MSTYKKVSTLLTLLCVLYMCFLSLLQFSLQPGQRRKGATQSLTGHLLDHETHAGLQNWAYEGETSYKQARVFAPSKSELAEYVSVRGSSDLYRGFLWQNADFPIRNSVGKLESVRLRKLSEKSRLQTFQHDSQFTSSHHSLHDHRKESHSQRDKHFVPDKNDKLVSESHVDFISVGDDVYVFGAYLDTRYAQTNLARILTLRPSANLTMKMVCRYSDIRNRSIDAMAEEYEMCENHDKKYGGWIYSCSLPGFVPARSRVISLRIITEDRRTSSSFTSIHLQPMNHDVYRTQTTQTTSAQTGVPQHQYQHQTNTDPSTSFTSKSNSSPHNKTVHYLESHSNRTRGRDTKTLKLGVCVPPLFGGVYLSKLINFIEMCRLLGAHKLFLYINDISDEIKIFLQHYRGLDPSILHLLDWNLPVIKKSPSSPPTASSASSTSPSLSFPSSSSIANQIIWNYGQLLAVQHCLYANMADYDWLLFMDTDEMLVPQTTATWPDLVSQIVHQSHQEFRDTHIAGISFESAFFQQDFQTQVTNSIDYFQYLHRTRQTSEYRSKLLVQPSKVFELGIHHLSKPIRENLKVIKAPPAQGLLHHYRKCVADEGEDIRCEILVKDERILKYEVPLTIASREVTKAAMEFFASKL